MILIVKDKLGGLFVTLCKKSEKDMTIKNRLNSGKVMRKIYITGKITNKYIVNWRNNLISPLMFKIFI